MNIASYDNAAVHPALEAKGARVIYGELRAIDNVTFSFPRGSMVGLVGPNGGGKSTLMDALVGLVELDRGEVSVMGRPPSEARGRIGYVPQSENVNWRFPITVWQVVMMGQTARKKLFGFPSQKDKEAVSDALKRVGLLERSNDPIYELSGGQRQRAFVARALAQNADVLLLDEAFSGVDVASQNELVEVLREVCTEGCTVMMSTHDLTNLADRFDHVLCLNGHVCACGPPEEAFTPAVLEELYGDHGVLFKNG